MSSAVAGKLPRRSVHYRNVAGVRGYLVQRRRELGLSQNDLDARIGCTDGLVAKWEIGERHPGPYLFWCWVDALHLEMRLATPREERA